MSKFAPGRSLEKGTCEKCLRPKHEHHPVTMECPDYGAGIQSEVNAVEVPEQTLPAPPLPAVIYGSDKINAPTATAKTLQERRKVVGALGALTPEAFAEMRVKGFTEFIIRNPHTSEEYICQPPLFPPSIVMCWKCSRAIDAGIAAKSGICPFCGSTLQKPLPGSELVMAALDVANRGWGGPEVSEDGTRAMDRLRKALGVALPAKPDEPQKEPSAPIIPPGAVCPKCHSTDVKHHGHCEEHDPSKKVEVMPTVSDSEKAGASLPVTSGASAPPQTRKQQKQREQFRERIDNPDKLSVEDVLSRHEAGEDIHIGLVKAAMLIVG